MQAKSVVYDVCLLLCLIELNNEKQFLSVNVCTYHVLQHLGTWFPQLQPQRNLATALQVMSKVVEVTSQPILLFQFSCVITRIQKAAFLGRVKEH